MIEVALSLPDECRNEGPQKVGTTLEDKLVEPELFEASHIVRPFDSHQVGVIMLRLKSKHRFAAGANAASQIGHRVFREFMNQRLAKFTLTQDLRVLAKQMAHHLAPAAAMVDHGDAC